MKSITKRELEVIVIKNETLTYEQRIGILNKAFPPPEPQSIFLIRYGVGELELEPNIYFSFKEALSSRDSHEDVVVKFMEVIE